MTADNNKEVTAMENKTHDKNNKSENKYSNNSGFGTKATSSEKTAVDNQWVSTGILTFEDNRERRDGPGGESGI